MKRRLHRSPNDSNGISRLAIRFVAPVLFSLTVMLVAAVLSIELLSTIRAWVGGEGLYSKGQKNATYYLSEYTRSQSAEDFRLYQAAIAFPLATGRRGSRCNGIPSTGTPSARPSSRGQRPCRHRQHHHGVPAVR